jgi:hypothetical protein
VVWLGRVAVGMAATVLYVRRCYLLGFRELTSVHRNSSRLPCIDRFLLTDSGTYFNTFFTPDKWKCAVLWKFCLVFTGAAVLFQSQE